MIYNTDYSLRNWIDKSRGFGIHLFEGAIPASVEAAFAQLNVEGSDSAAIFNQAVMHFEADPTLITSRNYVRLVQRSAQPQTKQRTDDGEYTPIKISAYRTEVAVDLSIEQEDNMQSGLHHFPTKQSGYVVTTVPQFNAYWLEYEYDQPVSITKTFGVSSHAACDYNIECWAPIETTGVQNDEFLDVSGAVEGDTYLLNDTVAVDRPYIAEQLDDTLDVSGAVEGDVYLLSDVSNLHVSFGTIAGVANGDLVQLQSAEWVIVSATTGGLHASFGTIAGVANGDIVQLTAGSWVIIDGYEWKTYGITDANILSPVRYAAGMQGRKFTKYRFTHVAGSYATHLCTNMVTYVSPEIDQSGYVDLNPTWALVVPTATDSYDHNLGVMRAFLADVKGPNLLAAVTLSKAENITVDDVVAMMNLKVISPNVEA